MPRARSGTPRRLLAGLAIATFSAMLGGCDLFGSSSGTPVVALPDTLEPETQAFNLTASRSWTWEEWAKGADGDTLLSLQVWRAARGSDSVDPARPFLELYRMNGPSLVPASVISPAPAGVYATLGFRTDRIAFDPVAAPDPGSSWPLPALPIPAGWRADTTVGDLRLVRTYTRTRTVSAHGQRHACREFADSTYESGANGTLLAHGTACFGAVGLVQRELVVPGYTTATGKGGTFVRTITVRP